MAQDSEKPVENAEMLFSEQGSILGDRDLYNSRSASVILLSKCKKY
jgi:hypothetical protein